LVNPIFLEFGAGVALALAWPRLKRAPLWIGLALVVAAVTAFAVQAVVGHGVSISIEPVLRGDEIGRVVAFGLPAAALVTGAAVLNRALAGRIVETAAWLGDASYSTYLTQAMTVPAVGAIALAIELRNRAAVELLAVLACMAFGAITYAVIEKPILRDLKRLGWDGRASARRMAVGGDPA
jgi:exopolysaccharide production protein ExoZ